MLDHRVNVEFLLAAVSDNLSIALTTATEIKETERVMFRNIIQYCETLEPSGAKAMHKKNTGIRGLLVGEKTAKKELRAWILDGEALVNQIRMLLNELVNTVVRVVITARF